MKQLNEQGILTSGQGATQEPEGTGPWAAVILNEFETRVTVVATKERATAVVAAYAREWWDTEMDGVDLPEDDQAVIDEYYEARGDRGESYSICEAALDL